MFQPPRLGVGLVYNSFLFDYVVADPELVDFLEIEPETLWVQLAPGRSEFRMVGNEFDQLRALPYTKLLHSIGFPVGGSQSPDLAHVALLNRMADDLESPWVSEHLSFNTAVIDGELTRFGMLLPQLQTAEGVDCAVRSTRVSLHCAQSTSGDRDRCELPETAGFRNERRQLYLPGRREFRLRNPCWICTICGPMNAMDGRRLSML